MTGKPELMVKLVVMTVRPGFESSGPIAVANTQARLPYLAFRISLSKSGFDSSRTRCGYISPP